MSHHDFLRSFKQAWGIEVDRQPQTVRGLLELGEAARENPDLMGDLIGSAERLYDLVADVLEACIHDIDSNAGLDPALLPHLEGSVDGYQLMLDGAELLTEEDVDLERALSLLDKGIKKQQHHQEGIALWQNQPACPRCASRSRETRTCETCGVHLVVPDLNPPPLPAVELGGHYLDLRIAAGQVAQGEAPLSILQEALDALAEELFTLNRLLGQLKGFDASAFLEVLESLFSGLERMQSFETSCEIADLNQGWLVVSQGGLKLRSLSPTLPSA